MISDLGKDRSHRGRGLENMDGVGGLKSSQTPITPSQVYAQFLYLDLHIECK